MTVGQGPTKTNDLSSQKSAARPAVVTPGERTESQEMERHKLKLVE
jgi:hypothetical protein